MQTGYIVEQVIFASWSLVLFGILTQQVKQDNIIASIFTLQAENNETIILQKIKKVGFTTVIFHTGCWIGTIILLIRSIDPFPVLGVFSYSTTDLLSHIGIAVLLTTLFEGIGFITAKMYNKLNLSSVRFLQCSIHVISVTTFIVAIVTWVIENYIEDLLVYSAGVYFLYGTIIQWIILILYSKTISLFKSEINKNNEFKADNTIKKLLSKLKWIEFVFLLINIIVTIYQVYTFINQLNETVSSVVVNKDNYKPIQAPLYIVQIIAYTIILWFSYISHNEIGNTEGLSEISTTKTNNIEGYVIPKEEIVEIVVGFKNNEINGEKDDEKVLTDNELLNKLERITQNMPTNEQFDSFKSDASEQQQISQEEMKRLMIIIAEQEKAEQERIAKLKAAVLAVELDYNDYISQKITEYSKESSSEDKASPRVEDEVDKEAKDKAMPIDEISPRVEDGSQRDGSPRDEISPRDKLDENNQQQVDAAVNSLKSKFKFSKIIKHRLKKPKRNKGK